jgi:hypothetical protein
MAQITPGEGRKAMTTPSATMKLVTPEALNAGQKQSLSIKITTIGYKSVILSTPVGGAESALMTIEEFKKCRINFAPAAPKGFPDLDKSTVGSVLISIPPRKQAEELTLTISFQDFLVEQHTGAVDIKLHGNDLKGPPLDVVPIVKSSTPPQIKSFTATSYSVFLGNPVELSWSIDRECDYKLVTDEKTPTTLTSGKGKEGNWAGLLDGSGNYILNVQAGDQAITRRLKIHGFSATSFESYYLNLGDKPTEILGLYAHPNRGRLYALVRFGADSVAQLWSTDHGFDHHPETWQPVKNKLDQTIEVKVEAARRPGVIFRDRLWLLGGDCCQPDKPGRNVGYYDFQETQWHEVGDDDSRGWPKGMTQRMGHAVVAPPFKDRIWVMGGWSQNGGLCNDIWEFDANSWTKLGLACDACLFGAAATAEAVWRVGGFASPGGAAGKTAIKRYDKDNKDIAINFSIAPGNQYCASGICAIDEEGDDLCGAGTFYNSGTKEYMNIVFFVDKERSHNFESFPLLSARGVLLPRDYYHIQTTVFQGAAFFRTLRPDGKAAGDNKEAARRNISYLVRVK